MHVTRTLKHLFATRIGTRARFSTAVESAITAAIRAAEARTSGEIRFAVETALDTPRLWAGMTAAARARQVFASLGVWDTELRNGVLIYVLMADRQVEIVADRGAASRMAPDEWNRPARLMEVHFRARHFREGAVVGVEAVGELLARYFPPGPANRDELPNQPTLL